MKAIALFTALSLAFSPAAFSSASAQPVNANDTACGAIVCLDGELAGIPGGVSCPAYEKAYFSILVPSHHGINWTATAALRRTFLQSCGVGAATNEHAVEMVQERFGHSLGL